MFRKIRRFKQEMPAEECRELLKTQVRGVLSLLGTTATPTACPSTTGITRPTASSTSTARKRATRSTPSAPAIRHPSASTTRACAWTANGRCTSAVLSCLAALAPVTDEAATALACKELSRKFTPDDEYFNKEYAAAKDRVLCLALTPEHITGKRIKEN